MNPHILFLDIDGVLNNRASMQIKGVQFEGHWFPTTLAPDCVARANRLVKEGGLDVVLSSVWRYGRPWEVTSRFFQECCGFEFGLIGATPRAWKSKGRGEEIQRWRDEHNDTRPFVILDDDSDMWPHMDRLVKCSHEPGLQDAQVDEALRLLGVL